MPWRRTLFSLHRDIGFVCLGLTLVYAISGVAVNHHHHWDYNRSTTIETTTIGDPAALLGAQRAGVSPGVIARKEEKRLVEQICRALKREDRPRKAFWRGPDRLSLFFGRADRDVVDYSPARGQAVSVQRSDRPLLRQLNRLHLNEGKGAWTYFADLYAVALAFLAISGVLIVRGRLGLLGRGGLLLLVGVVLPILALWLF